MDAPHNDPKKPKDPKPKKNRVLLKNKVNGVKSYFNRKKFENLPAKWLNIFKARDKV